MLSIDVARRLGPLALDVRLEAPDRGVLVIAGESGAGKSTLLRLVAGLLAPDRGRVALGDEPLFDSALGIDRPPEARPIGWVPQDDALFPHLSVVDNVAFGLRASRVPRGAAAARALSTLERLGIAELATRRPATLSGGQRQRVALARALALAPSLLLLDEPLAALDVRTRERLRGELRRLLADLPCATLLVTHTPTDALALGDRIAVLEDGRLTQYGTRDELLARPRSGYIADFLGLNLFLGPVSRAPDGLASLAVGEGRIAIADPGGEGEVYAVIRPREITLTRDAPAGSARNALRGAISEIVPEPSDGERLRVRVESTPRLVAEITRAAAEAMRLAPGDQVWASFKATGVTTFR
jgi:molybdate transport system ATP-binding protein